MTVSIIVAMAQNGVIGRGNRLPWHIPEDFKWFRTHTQGRPVIMGRKTFESIGKILPGRRNLILSTKAGYSVPGAECHTSLEKALESCAAGGHEEAFVIGGEKLFRETLPLTDRIYLTVIHRDFEGDAFFPAIPEGEFKTVFEESHPGKSGGDSRERNRVDDRCDLSYTFKILARVSHPSRF
jgi:dihydrofolate reductase